MKVTHAEKSGARYMSDGYLTLAILRNRGEATPSGINHFGFQVDDLADIEKKARQVGRAGDRAALDQAVRRAPRHGPGRQPVRHFRARL